MNFLFDVKLFSSVRIEADSEKEAREKLSEVLDCATVNFGSVDGEPVTGEASIDGELDLIEIDGEAQ